jgi:hypothetical protein
MTERDDPALVERTLHDLATAAQNVAGERAARERVIATTRAALDAVRADLTVTERAAKQQRQAQIDAVRGRADIERRLHDLGVAEALARTRRQHAEQKALGFRAAATFAASGRADAEGASDGDRTEHERLAEARATHEASAAESRAAEERAREAEIGRLRAELELQVAAERDVEAAFTKERDDTERGVAGLRDTLERTAADLHEAEVLLERLASEAERISAERAGIEKVLHDSSRRTRENIKSRIAELRHIEADAASERAEQERLLASVIAQENDVAREIVWTEPVPAPPVAAAAPQPADQRAKLTFPQPLKTAASAPPAPAKTKATESFVRPAPAPARRPVEKPAAGAHDELIPGLKSLMSNVFARKKTGVPPAPVVEAGSSAADRIARDFGLLGATAETPAAAPSATTAPAPEEP